MYIDKSEERHYDTLELRAYLVRWALEYKRAHKGKGKLLEILRSSKARGITWNTLAVKTTFHSSLKKKKQKTK